jgi:FkbM family methyltransferase
VTTDADVLTILLPGGSFLMSAESGRDLVARIAHEGGWDAFERPLPAVFLRCVQQWPGLLVDIGANTGFYAFMAMSANADMRVVAYEPDPKVLEVLKRNEALNGFGERLRVEPVALSDHAGVAQLYIPLQNHGLVESSSSLQADFKDEHSETVTVELRTLDEHLGLTTPVSLIKIDVEGHEKMTVAGAEGVIAASRPIVFVELLDKADYGYFNDLAARLNYRALRLRESEAIEEAVMELDYQGWNHVLVPQERWATFLGLLRELGL